MQVHLKTLVFSAGVLSCWNTQISLRNSWSCLHWTFFFRSLWRVQWNPMLWQFDPGGWFLGLVHIEGRFDLSPYSSGVFITLEAWVLLKTHHLTHCFNPVGLKYFKCLLPVFLSLTQNLIFVKVHPEIKRNCEFWYYRLHTLNTFIFLTASIFLFFH